MPDIEAKANDIQEKFELYLVGLIFTILALSVQTSSFGTCRIADALELAGWAALLFSDISGLLRLEVVPVALRYYAAKERGKVVDETHLKSIEKTVSSRKSIWCFVAGLIFLMIARAVPAFSFALAGC